MQAATPLQALQLGDLQEKLPTEGPELHLRGNRVGPKRMCCCGVVRLVLMKRAAPILFAIWYSSLLTQ